MNKNWSDLINFIVIEVSESPNQFTFRDCLSLFVWISVGLSGSKALSPLQIVFLSYKI